MVFANCRKSNSKIRISLKSDFPNYIADDINSLLPQISLKNPGIKLKKTNIGKLIQKLSKLQYLLITKKLYLTFTITDVKLTRKVQNKIILN